MHIIALVSREAAKVSLFISKKTIALRIARSICDIRALKIELSFPPNVILYIGERRTID